MGLFLVPDFYLGTPSTARCVDVIAEACALSAGVSGCGGICGSIDSFSSHRVSCQSCADFRNLRIAATVYR